MLPVVTADRDLRIWLRQLGKRKVEKDEELLSVHAVTPMKKRKIKEEWNKEKEKKNKGGRRKTTTRTTRCLSPYACVWSQRCSSTRHKVLFPELRSSHHGQNRYLLQASVIRVTIDTFCLTFRAILSERGSEAQEGEWNKEENEKL